MLKIYTLLLLTAGVCFAQDELLADRLEQLENERDAARIRLKFLKGLPEEQPAKPDTQRQQEVNYMILDCKKRLVEINKSLKDRSIDPELQLFLKKDKELVLSTIKQLKESLVVAKKIDAMNTEIRTLRKELEKEDPQVSIGRILHEKRQERDLKKQQQEEAKANEDDKETQKRKAKLKRVMDDLKASRNNNG